MSIELRIRDDHLECDWGVIDNSNPQRGEVCSLMIITRDLADEIAADGFVRVELNGRRYVWQLFEAHWWDGKGPSLCIGRWPD